jgi:hypothetical protein
LLADDNKKPKVDDCVRIFSAPAGGDLKLETAHAASSSTREGGGHFGVLFVGSSGFSGALSSALRRAVM